eukprot:CAMPEP_0176502158 /NCGR_PEP_ID=MMETSP0200_2-20121128/14594_1 /TAXON_ID=947934 /ORGANISM="Chaetoceros sp., Strain GSL56" /LENGTH=612 /DNA_ID=CAMNT_0017901191 /DNA_START=282 /DNA_END=2120 /DNA_ORIENTATION=-
MIRFNQFKQATETATRTRKQILSESNNKLRRSTISSSSRRRRKGGIRDAPGKNKKNSDTKSAVSFCMIDDHAGVEDCKSQKENQYPENSQIRKKNNKSKLIIKAGTLVDAAVDVSPPMEEKNGSLIEEDVLSPVVNEHEQQETFLASGEYDFCFADSSLVSSTCSNDDFNCTFETNHHHHQQQQQQQQQQNKSKDSRGIENVQRSIVMVDQQYQRDLDSRLRTLYSKACTALKISNFDDALHAFEELLNILVEEYGTSHKRVATALQNLSIVHQRAGNLEEGLDCIETAIKIRKRKLGKYHMKVADALAEMGLILMAREEYEDSLEIMSEALAICERELSRLPDEECDKVNLQIAKILNDMGCVSFEYGEKYDAKDAFQQSLSVQKDCYEFNGFTSMPGFLATSTTICNQGIVAIANADYETAIEKLEDALKIQRNVLEPTSVTIMTTMEHLAYAYLKYGGLDKSLEQYQIILGIIKERRDVDNHYRMLSQTLKNIAYCQVKLFEFDEAISTLKKLQKISMETVDDDPAYVPIHDEDILHLIANIRTHESKVPSLCEFVSKTLTTSGYRNPWDSDLLFRCGYDMDEGMNLEIITPKPPHLRTKMYGHKVSFP